MKPLKVMMSAFGPYKDEIIIDFTKLGDSGIFLITGDTGSGKTTIFDAISFALFGISSGSRRENISFRSDFADSNVATFVKLEFFHKGILYNVERIPRYYRKKKRGDGVTLVGGDATLTFLNEVITGDKNVTDKCVEILGMNSKQFKQIVMIAQGEFMELLLAKSKDRAEIFRHIFDTGIFKDISDKLKDIYLKKKREYEDISLENNNYIKEVQIDNILLENYNTEEILHLLKEEIEKNSELIIQLEKDKEIEFNNYQKLIKKISKGKIMNNNIFSLNKYKKELSILLNEENGFLKKNLIYKKNLDIYDNVIPYFNEKRRILADIDEKKKILNNKEKEFLKVNDEFLKCLKSYDDIGGYQKEILIIKKNIDDTSKKIELFDEIDCLKSELNELVKILNYNNLLNKREELDKIDLFNSEMINLDKLKQKLLEVKDNYILKNKEYLDNYDLFLNAQAGIIASRLKLGDSCPVCGSTNHPCKAKLIDNVMTKEELDLEKDMVDDLYKELEALRLDITLKENELNILNNHIKDISYDKLKEEILLLEKDCSNFNIDELDVDIDVVDKKINSLNTIISDKSILLGNVTSRDELINMINTFDKDINQLEFLIKDIKIKYEEILKKKVKLESLIENLKLDIIKLEKQFEDATILYVKSYQDLGYKNENDYLKIKISKEELEIIDREFKEYSDKKIDLYSKVETLEKIVNGSCEVNINVLEDELYIINKKINDIDLSLKELNNKVSSNKKIYIKLKNVSDKILNLEKEVMVYKDLSDTANGNIVGKSKLEFEQFVQARYFDQVINFANTRFKYMTDDRYEFFRKEEATRISDKLGLELEVMDYYTGKRRDVKTLSGGESFKAALSLSLGMSDAIQFFAGGVVIEAMFIDEGFGSLDDESLDSAMNAIMLLSQGDRIIGIISHVNELKARIDNKIIVKKSNCGSIVDIVN